MGVVYGWFLHLFWFLKENVRKLVESNQAMFDEIDAKIRSMSSQLDLGDDEFELDDGDDDDDFDIRTLGDDDDN